MRIAISCIFLMPLFDSFFNGISLRFDTFMSSPDGMLVRLGSALIGFWIACGAAMSAAGKIRSIGQRRWPLLPNNTPIYGLALDLFPIAFGAIPISLFAVVYLDISVVRWVYPLATAILYGLALFLISQIPFEQKYQGPFTYLSLEKGKELWRKQNGYT